MNNTFKDNEFNNSDIVKKKEETHYHYELNEYEEDLGIIQDIFSHILTSPKKGSSKRENSLIDVNEKIEINFEDYENIKNLLLGAYLHISLVEDMFESLESYDQDVITSDIYANYLELKYEGDSNEQILFKLCKCYIPTGKKQNPEYKSIARSLVLFFFEDCTWGEKTQREKDKEKNR